MGILSLVGLLTSGRKGMAGQGAGDLFPYPSFKELGEAGS